MIRALLLAAVAAIGVAAAADDPLGYQRLRSEVGAALADGSGVVVAQVEPPSVMLDEDSESTRRSHVPQSSADFDGVVFHNIKASTPRGSRHATATASRFYGRKQSMAPGVGDVHLFTANEFLQGLAAARRWPRARVWSHSWVGASGASDERLLRSLDSAVQRHDWVVAVGVSNRGPNKPLLASAFNVLSVGRSDGGHSIGAAGVGDVYHERRGRPHLVAPASRTSMATPQVASAAVVLLQTLPKRFARASVVRAALMAGATRRFERRADPEAEAEIQPDYRANATVQTGNGLDTRFGAGQLNIYNSYQIVTGRRTRSIEKDPQAPAIDASGFDYEAAFGGVLASNRRARYRIAPTADQTLTAALIWPAPGGSSRSVMNLDLQVRDVTDASRLLDESAANTDTGEHIRATLVAGRDYELIVSAARPYGSSTVPYALAWRLD